MLIRDVVVEWDPIDIAVVAETTTVVAEPTWVFIVDKAHWYGLATPQFQQQEPVSKKQCVIILWRFHCSAHV